MIYLASPYSHENPEVRKARYTQVAQVTAALITRNHFIFSPIVYSHNLAVDFNLKGDWDFWQSLDRRFIAASTELWVLKLDGWDLSQGIAAEVNYALELKLPIKYFNLSELL